MWIELSRTADDVNATWLPLLEGDEIEASKNTRKAKQKGGTIDNGVLRHLLRALPDGGNKAYVDNKAWEDLNILLCYVIESVMLAYQCRLEGEGKQERRVEICFEVYAYMLDYMDTYDFNKVMTPLNFWITYIKGAMGKAIYQNNKAQMGLDSLPTAILAPNVEIPAFEIREMARAGAIDRECLSEEQLLLLDDIVSHAE